jgi:cytochrome P450
VHFCLGSHLARLEIKIAFEELIPRLADIELAGKVDRLRLELLQRIKRFPVRVTPA